MSLHALLFSLSPLSPTILYPEKFKPPQKKNPATTPKRKKGGDSSDEDEDEEEEEEEEEEEDESEDEAPPRKRWVHSVFLGGICSFSILKQKFR